MNERLSFRPPVSSFVIMDGSGQELVTIHRGGTLSFAPEYTPDAAALALWAAVAARAPIDPESGAGRIVAEQRRQRTTEGFTPDRDRDYANGELAMAAVCYALPFTDDRRRDALIFNTAPEGWPWGRGWWKPGEVRYTHDEAVPTREGRIRELEKAGALIASEIDRLRAEGSHDAQG